MKTLALTFVIVMAACMASNAVEEPPAYKSLKSLLKNAVSTSLSHAQDTFDELSKLWGDLDWQESTLPDVFSAAPCEKMCQVCWLIPYQNASEECEEFCEDKCNYDFEKDDDNGIDLGKGKRNLIELCLGLGGIDINIGGPADGGGLGGLVSLLSAGSDLLSGLSGTGSGLSGLADWASNALTGNFLDGVWDGKRWGLSGLQGLGGDGKFMKDLKDGGLLKAFTGGDEKERGGLLGVLTGGGSLGGLLGGGSGASGGSSTGQSGSQDGTSGGGLLFGGKAGTSGGSVSKLLGGGSSR